MDFNLKKKEKLCFRQLQESIEKECLTTSHQRSIPMIQALDTLLTHIITWTIERKLTQVNQQSLTT